MALTPELQVFDAPVVLLLLVGLLQLDALLEGCIRQVLPELRNLVYFLLDFLRPVAIYSNLFHCH